MQLRRSHVLALVSAAVLIASALPWPNALVHADLCPFHALTGLPCPGCGLTHAFRAIAHGEFAAAWGYNPFGFVFFAIAIALLAAPLSGRRLAPRHATILGLALVGSMLVFGVARAAEVLAHPR